MDQHDLAQRDLDRRQNHPQIRLLPEKRVNWRTLCASYGAQAAVLLILLVIGILTPEKMGLKTYHIEMVALKPYEPPPPPKIRIKIPKLEARLTPPVPVEVPKLLVPRETTLGQRLLKFAGRAKELPADMADNHDHYLHGQPKR